MPQHTVTGHKHTLRSHVGMQCQLGLKRMRWPPQWTADLCHVSLRMPRTALRFGIPESSGWRLTDVRSESAPGKQRSSPSLCYCLGLCQDYHTCSWAQAPLRGGDRTWKSPAWDSSCHASAMWQQADMKRKAGKPISSLWENGTRWDDWQQFPCHSSPRVGREQVCYGKVPLVPGR